MTDRINQLADDLVIAESFGWPPEKPWGQRDWRVWTLRQRNETMHTYVIQGPTFIVVQGDLADHIFERHGGLALGFVKGGLSYAAEKCRAGNVYGYDADKAREDARDAIADLVEQGEEADLIEDLTQTIKYVDFDDERAVREWWDKPRDETPNFGRVYNDGFLRACACVLRVYQYETSKDG